ncbi:MAG TPA: cytochrome b [Steroidobacteraceae bacterium]|nr:cytochrome b [Steroidobacteraceae bacterium]
MQLRNTEYRYGAVAQLLHWSIVALVIAQFVLAEIAEDLPTGLEKLATLARHKSVGITILGLAVLRLAWRAINKTPAPPPQMPGWQRVAARISHVGLYALLFVQPLTGWLMSSAKNYPVSWFGAVTLPDLIAPSERLFEVFEEAHEIGATLLFVLAGIHAAAALKHHFVDRDDVLRRMLPWPQRESR